MTLVELFAFTGITCFSVRISLIFGMVQQKIGNIQTLGNFTGILYRRMVLLIGFKNIPLFIEAEGLVQEPFAVAGISTQPLVIRFIAAAGQLFPIV